MGAPRTVTIGRHTWNVVFVKPNSDGTAQCLLQRKGGRHDPANLTKWVKLDISE
jgi:hypothetical protein